MPDNWFALQGSAMKHADSLPVDDRNGPVTRQGGVSELVSDRMQINRGMFHS